jgi:Rrf2 family protein
VNVSQKSRYALKAILELAFRYGQGPVSISQIARAQVIPARFLEAILAQLKRGGFVASRRGNVGGYVLARLPAEISVGDVLRLLEGPVLETRCANHPMANCPHCRDCTFAPMWEAAAKALNGIYDDFTFKDLAERYRANLHAASPGAS